MKSKKLVIQKKLLAFVTPNGESQKSFINGSNLYSHSMLLQWLYIICYAYSLINLRNLLLSSRNCVYNLFTGL